MGSDSVKSTVFHTQGHDSSAGAVTVHDQVQSKVLHCSKKSQRDSTACVCKLSTLQLSVQDTLLCTQGNRILTGAMVVSRRKNFTTA